MLFPQRVATCKKETHGRSLYTIFAQKAEGPYLLILDTLLHRLSPNKYLNAFIGGGIAAKELIVLTRERWNGLDYEVNTVMEGQSTIKDNDTANIEVRLYKVASEREDASSHTIRCGHFFSLLAER